ncbi:ISL3 family transposase [Ktedonosporobacter rubrisoli]|nr:ISL3 family transposase [Ktedonosporobacter rubrisoli]
MEGTTLLPLPEGLRMTELRHQENVLIVEVLSEQARVRCPLCGQESTSVHSRYLRRLKDVPCGGQAVCLHLRVRKFFCQNQQCSRHIFTERLPNFVEPWAQMTYRLVQALQAIGLATSGSLGARLASRLGVATSWMTILRRVMALATPDPHSVTTLGIDDFSFKRGRKFGTILVDLSTHQVIDLLPERSAESAAEWLRRYPEIQYISRDRGKDYAQGANSGAPQATQISDRFHLMQNFVKAVEAEVERCYKYIQQAPSPDLKDPNSGQRTSDSDEADYLSGNKQEMFEQVKDLLAHGHSAAEVAKQFAIPVRRVYHWKAREDYPAGEVKRTKRADLLERCEHIHQLRAAGFSNQEIAEQLAISERTVRRWQKRRVDGTINQPRRKRSGSFGPYAPYVLSRWQQGEWSVDRIFQEIQAQGFSGSVRTVYRFVKPLRQDFMPLPHPPPRVTSRVTIQNATWLLVRPSESLKADEKADLEELCHASPELATLSLLAQSFGKMVRGREGHRLADWMKQVRESSLRHIKRFASGLQRDQAEVLAGLTHSFSNGQVEGFVNKLKLIKRQGYGRALFRLLRQCMLHTL